MKLTHAISIQQPWAWLIAQGYKDVENRTWHTGFRGPIAIHAGKTVDVRALELVPQRLGVRLPARRMLEAQTGGIVGYATMTDCVEQHDSKWFFGPFGFCLAGARPLTLIPMRGQLGVWRLDEVVEVEA